MSVQYCPAAIVRGLDGDPLRLELDPQWGHIDVVVGAERRIFTLDGLKQLVEAAARLEVAHQENVTALRESTNG